MNATLETKPPIKRLADFTRYGLIGKWYGALRLIAVELPTDRPQTIRNAQCRTICAKGHEQSVAWARLRDSAIRHTCAECEPTSNRRKTSYTVGQIWRRVEDLTPERRRFFDALLRTRPGDTTKELLLDCVSYAAEIPDPVAELRELTAPKERAAGYGSSLAPARLLYLCVE